MAASLRLLTANLLKGEADPRHLSELLARLDPDVVLAQELAPNAAEVLANRFPHHSLRPSHDFLGHGVATRTVARFVDVPLPHRPGVAAFVDMAGATVLVVGVHLLNPVNLPWWSTASKRRQQIDTLHTWIDALTDPVDAVVVAGDMNASPIWPAYRRLSERYQDLVAAAATRDGVKPEATWGWRPGWPRMLRIDHIFGRGLTVTSYSVHEVPGSDHAALVTDLVLS